MITQEKLKEALDYCPETGVFVWLINRQRVNIGDVAGSKDHYGYVSICIFGKRYGAHRLAWVYMTGSYPNDQIDHIDGVRDNNIFSNLRQATGTENRRNKCLYKSSTSGFKGVTYLKKKKKYSAKIYYDKKAYHLGFFKTPEEAGEAYKKAATEYHGEFARF